MERKQRFIAIAIPVLALAGLGLGVAAARGGDGDEPLTGATLERASAAALAYTGGGQVVEAETGDDGAAYDVEVRRPDGATVEVRLDSAFAVIGHEADDDSTDDESSDD
ncbi:MAG: PepSY domain-containing protein [Dehalococcoidia bacterium]